MIWSKKPSRDLYLVSRRNINLHLVQIRTTSAIRLLTATGEIVRKNRLEIKVGYGSPMANLMNIRTVLGLCVREQPKGRSICINFPKIIYYCDSLPQVVYRDATSQSRYLQG